MRASQPSLQSLAIIALVISVGPAQRALAAPIISEVAWAGSTCSTSDEFIEVMNPGPGDIADLSSYVIVLDDTPPEGWPLPAVSLPVGGIVVIELRPGGEAISNQDNPTFSDGLLNSPGSALRLCPAGDVTPTSCDVAHDGIGDWPAGTSSPDRRSMERIDPFQTGPGAWVTWDLRPTTALDSGGGGTCAGTPMQVRGSPGEVPFVLVDGGVFVDPDAGPEPEPDAPPDGGDPIDDGGAPGEDAGPPVVDPLPVITEVCFAGSQTSASDEWIEIYNPSAAEVTSLSNFVLVQGGTLRTLDPVSIPPGGFLLLERRAEATSLEPPLTVVRTFGNGLTNGGQTLALCRAEDTDDCDVVNPAGAAWFGGDSDDKTTMVRWHPNLPGDLASSWRSSAGTSAAVTDSGGLPSPGSPGEAVFEFPGGVDGGPGPEDGGGPEPDPEPSTGPNDPPWISVTEPASDAEGDPVSIAWSAGDDDGDPVEVSLFYDVDGDGNDGVLIARGLPGVENASYEWVTSAVPSGRYRVFARATDLRGATSYDYAPGQVDVGEGGDGATLILTEPDGVNDPDSLGRVTIRWEVSVPGNAGGVISLFYDTDGEGADGVGIATGFDALAEESTFLWDTGDLEPGTYYVYAVLDWSRGQEVTYSAPFNVQSGSCGCTSTRFCL